MEKIDGGKEKCQDFTLKPQVGMSFYLQKKNHHSRPNISKNTYRTIEGKITVRKRSQKKRKLPTETENSLIPAVKLSL